VGFEDLRAAAAEWDAAMRRDWSRSLPFTEAVTDRWERAATLGFGKNASIYNLSCVYGDVQVGEHTWIGPFTLLDGSGGLSIGDWCSISAGVQIYTHDTTKWALSLGEAPYVRRPTTVGDGCMIGPATVISAGVTIGARCLLGAHAYVNRDIPPRSVAVGVPARVVGEVRDGDDGPELHYF
jgi:acetyltransferase-like isoleucine patch superfamily enzyme